MKQGASLVRASLVLNTRPGEEEGALQEILRSVAPIGGEPTVLVDWEIRPAEPVPPEISAAIAVGKYEPGQAFADRFNFAGDDWFDVEPVALPKGVAAALHTLLEKADALQVDDGRATTEWKWERSDPQHGVHLVWYDKDDELEYRVSFTPEAIQNGRIDVKGRFHAIGDKGLSVGLRFFQLTALVPASQTEAAQAQQ